MSRANFSTYPVSSGPAGYTVTSTPEYRKAVLLAKANKGGVKAAQKGGGPEHIYRDPRLKQKSAQIAAQSTVVDEPTRSTIKKMADRKPFTATVEALIAYAAAQCKDRCDQIIQECEKTGKKFFDKSFFYGSRSNLYPQGSPDDCTVTEPTQIARLSDLYPSYPLIDSEGAGSYDIVQGAVGDCFFIGAVSALACTTAQAMNPVRRLFAQHSERWGVYGVVFSKNGGWEWVIVDDYIAVQDDGVTPLYANAAGQEMWPFIIEKAYAKLHYCWDSIDGGWGREALADMTGGLEYTIDLNGEQKGMKFEEFQSWVDDPMTILGCAVGQHVQEQGGAGRAGESGAVFGLFKGHAYSVLRVAKTSDGVGFVRVRNPWGNDAEWKGPYSDNAPEWKRKPLHFKELAPAFKDDGAFWMTWDDFRKYYTDIDICKYFHPKLKSITCFGTSKGKDVLKPDNTYIVEIKSPRKTTQIVATMGQDDPKAQSDHAKAKSTPYAVLRLSMYALNQVPKLYPEMPKCLGEKMETRKIYNRQVDNTLQLAPGMYSVVPQLLEAPAGLGYYVRFFCLPDDDISIYRYDNKAGTYLSTSGEPLAASLPQIPAAAPAPVDARRNSNPRTTTVGGTVGRSSISVPAPPVAPPQAPTSYGGGPVAPLPIDALFTSEGGLDLACKHAFTKADAWNRGVLDKRAAEIAFSQLLMSSEIGRSFQSTLQRSGVFQMTQQQFTQIATKALQEGTTQH